jgi:uncharacterized membrane protein YvbJ
MPPGFNGNTNQAFVSSVIDQPRSRRKLLRWIIFGIVIIVAIIIGLKFFLPDNSPDGVATRFVNDIVADKPSQAYSFTSSSFKADTSIKDWTPFVKSLSSSYTTKPKLFTAISSSVSVNTSPVAVFRVSSPNGTYNLMVYMGYNNNHWQVSYFNVSLL